MGCHKNIIDSLRLCGNGDDPVDECGQVNCVCHYGDRDPMCRQKIMYDAADAIEELLATVRSVVHCKDCEWWAKQDASIQGRCARFGFYPTGKFYCASGSMAEPPKGVE